MFDFPAYASNLGYIQELSDHPVQITHNIIIGKSHATNLEIGKIIFSPSVVILFLFANMRISIYFNHQFERRRIKINDKIAESELTPEFAS